MIYKKEFQNGVRLVLERNKSFKSVSIGFWINVGSRNEKSNESGIAHFIEHLLFKGTRRRNFEKISNEINEIGGQVDAFTSQEIISVYARIIDEQLPQGLDLLTDIFFKSKFDPVEIEREKKVVVEEIHLYNDTPEELVFDIFIETLWKGSPIGNPVLGRIETINSFKREQIKRFLERECIPERIVITASGNFEIKKFEKLISPIIKSISPNGVKAKNDHQQP